MMNSPNLQSEIRHRSMAEILAASYKCIMMWSCAVFLSLKGRICFWCARSKSCLLMTHFVCLYAEFATTLKKLNISNAE